MLCFKYEIAGGEGVVKGFYSLDAQGMVFGLAVQGK